MGFLTVLRLTVFNFWRQQCNNDAIVQGVLLQRTIMAQFHFCPFEIDLDSVFLSQTAREDYKTEQKMKTIHLHGSLAFFETFFEGGLSKKKPFWRVLMATESGDKWSTSVGHDTLIQHQGGSIFAIISFREEFSVTIYQIRKICPCHLPRSV